MPSLVVIGPQMKEKQRGEHNMVPKDPSLKRVKDLEEGGKWFIDIIWIMFTSNS